MSVVAPTLVATAGPDVCIEKTEVFDADFAEWIVNNKDIPKAEREPVRRLLRDNRIKGNQHQTLYKLGKDLKHDDIGRLHAKGGVGLQCCWRDTRAALTQKFYWDVDMRNAQPTLLQQYAEKRGWKCDKLKHFNENRDDYIDELRETLQIERWEVKEKICRIMFGGGSDGLTPFFVNELQPEMNMLMRNIFNENQAKYPTIAKKPNATRSMMANVLQSEERACLLAMDTSLAKQGRSLDVLIHDGGLVRKKDNEGKLPDEILRKCERDILESTGYRVSLVVKPITTTLERDDAEDDYELKKEQFERTGWKRNTYFKLRFPPMFVAISRDHVDQLTKTELLQNEEDNLCSDGKPFIKRWLEDPNKTEYDRMVFEPGRMMDVYNYNLFRGLPVVPVEGDWSIFHTLLTLLTGNDPLAYEWVENWVARRFQRLGEKSGVCPIFQGKKGVGKDTYWNQIGKLMGDEYFHNTGRPEHTVFARFNSQIARCLLVKFEEADFQVNKQNEEQLKNMITGTQSQIEKKGHPMITVNSYTDYVMTTNQEIPIPMTDDERRFAAFKVSDAKRGDTAFWKEVYDKLADGKQLAAYYHHLMTKDISGWSPSPVYKTRYYQDLVGVCAPLHARYFCDLLHRLDPDREEPVALGSSNDLMKEMTLKFPKFQWDNHKKFGIMMRDVYVEAGVIRKETGMYYNSYTAYPKELRKFLIEKGWWDE